MRRQSKSFAAAAIPALVATVAVAVRIDNARAAEECAPMPRSEAPPGSHWHYRTDPETKHKCWFLRSDAGADGDAQGAGARGAVSAQTETLIRRDCDTELSVLNYRKILAGLFHSQAASHEVDAQTAALAAKGCRTPDASAD